MPGYLTRELRLQLGDRHYSIRALEDRQQFSDADGAAERIGISSANWSLFGQVWPAGVALAEAMTTFEVAGKRVLELGCGLGLSSLVLQQREAQVVASDHHPLAETFLMHNASANGLPHVTFRHLSWARTDAALGRFDLIIGADILYERDHVDLLAAVLHRHGEAHCEVLIADPGRGNANHFSRALQHQGYTASESRRAFDPELPERRRGRMLSYVR
ncbi:class I SAM-dependent methyltransferase [Coralloluteibacterium thermophilus]|uniref:Class I SAM-dependent methyltransferase n=1 Tax=Coralloluteibacterium thermophilum TaxID=2707049 RepID=A0ABV9NJS9_9GAMM